MEQPTLGVRRGLVTRNISQQQKKYIIYSVAAIIILAIIFMLTTLIINENNNAKINAAQVAAEAKVELSNPVATQQINKVFNFAVKDKNGNTITTFQYKILSAELRDEVIVNGQKYHPIAGKTFLIINLAITNNFTQTINIQPRDYIRIMMDNSSEKLAPDIYNDQVSVQAISTNPTSLGMSIDTTAKDIKMQVGEITGTKTIIPLNLQYK